MRLEQMFGDSASVFMGESVFLVHLKIKCNMTGAELREKARNRGLSVFASSGKEEEGYAHIALSCCEVPMTKFPDAVALLKDIVNDAFSLNNL